MTIHFFTFSNIIAPSARQRVFFLAEELERRGYQTIIHLPHVLDITRTRWPKKMLLILQVVRSLFSIKKNDVLFLHRTIYSKHFFVIMACYLLLSRRRAIFDFDDPVYLHNYFKTKVFCKLSKAVIVCTHKQAEWARQFNGNVHIIHIVINPVSYAKFSKDYTIPRIQPVIGWLGTGPEHLRNLPLLVPVLRRLATPGNPSFTFVLIGAFKHPEVYALFQNISNVDVRFIDKLDYTDKESAPKEIQKFDIGVVPQRNDGEWDKGKTSMKVLEYMGCAVPVVVSLFGEMPYIVADGHNGFTASSEDEWVEKLGILLRDQALREHLGYAGQQTVRERYSFDAILPQVIQVIDSL